MKRLVGILVGLAWATTAMAHCLSELSAAGYVDAKINGIHGNSAQPEIYYVVLDESTCSAVGNAQALGSHTKAEHYLIIDSSDSALWSSLFSAHAKNKPVRFQLGVVQDGYNYISALSLESERSSQ